MTEFAKIRPRTRDVIGQLMRCAGLHGLSGWWDAGTDLKGFKSDSDDNWHYAIVQCACGAKPRAELSDTASLNWLSVHIAEERKRG